MSVPSHLRQIGSLMGLLGSADDKQVGRALDQIDSLLEQAGLTWADLGAKVATLGASAQAPDPRRSVTTNGGGGRPPSQWKLDCADIEKLMNHGGLDDWTETFIASLHDWTSQGRGISARQREILHEKLDQYGF